MLRDSSADRSSATAEAHLPAKGRWVTIASLGRWLESVSGNSARDGKSAAAGPARQVAVVPQATPHPFRDTYHRSRSGVHEATSRSEAPRRSGTAPLRALGQQQEEAACPGHWPHRRQQGRVPLPLLPCC